ncbi:MAG TPA: hypothetical protein VF173_19460 [Thermoanaerobaculia bacterium]|nr:hypothetical protein [Thermoanaerobaculia bacterium]
MEIIERDSVVDELVDELVPAELDWERLVVTYPLPALALVALGGFFLGRRHGRELVAAISTFAAAQVTANVGAILGRELG